MKKRLLHEKFVQQPLFTVLDLGFLRRRRSRLKKRDDKADECTDNGGAYPSHHNIIEGNVCDEQRMDRFTAQARCMQTVDE